MKRRGVVLGLGAAIASVLAPKAFAAPKPEPRDDVATTNVNTPVVIDVLANDTDPLGRPLRVSEVQPWSDRGGVVTVHEGGLSVRYAPPAGFQGADRFTYKVRALA